MLSLDLSDNIALCVGLQVFFCPIDDRDHNNPLLHSVADSLPELQVLHVTNTFCMSEECWVSSKFCTTVASGASKTIIIQMCYADVFFSMLAHLTFRRTFCANAQSCVWCKLKSSTRSQKILQCC